MKDQSKPVKDTITYKIEFNKEDYSLLKQRAEKKHLTMKEYGTLKLLDDVPGAEELRREIIKMMPSFYNCVHKIGNDEVKGNLTRMGEALCRL